MPKMRDILTKAEEQKIDELLIELLDAHSKKEAELIKKEIDEIYETARERYFSTLNGKDEQSSATERFIKYTLPKIRLKVSQPQEIRAVLV
jgi:gas vesicle protein